ncbi:hypothetical protein XENTR_v10014056 [Xenopus tropicalis]|nr:hypothetical protein XENTR_v10014056 [Xenopus tropicalis]
MKDIGMEQKKFKICPESHGLNIILAKWTMTAALLLVFFHPICLIILFQEISGTREIIYIARNPKDVAVSYYHFYKAIKKVKQKKDWETFLDDYLSGKVLSSSWFDHVKGWYTHQEDFNILFLTYEEMKKDLRSSVRQICRFVEKELDEREVDTIVEKATFQNMKQDPLANYTTVPEDTLDVKIATHLRKGTVGDWKNLMTVAQNEKFDKIYSEKMIGVPINFTWDISEGN